MKNTTEQRAKEFLECLGRGKSIVEIEQEEDAKEKAWINKYFRVKKEKVKKSD